MNNCICKLLLIVMFGQTCVFGATARVARGAGATEVVLSEQNDNVDIARSGRNVRAKQPISSSAVSARSATRTSVLSATNNAGQSVRAAKKQNAINIGTKIVDATVNTSIPQECISAYNGCMDSFCVIPNTSGGRCRCDDRAIKFDKVSDKIKQFDRTSEALATDGSKLLNLGKTADDIYSAADEAQKKVLQNQEEDVSDLFKISSGNKKSTILDMSGFHTSSLFDVMDRYNDDPESLTAREGKALHVYADRLCTEQIPEECDKYTLLLKTAYTNQIDGDCVAYENSLRKKSVDSEQIKQQAKSQLRAAALERYKEDNKYTSAGCVKEIKQCMMQDDNCGPGFKKCVYDPILLKTVKDKTRKKKIKIGSNANIEIANITYETLAKMRNVCEPSVDSCQKNRDEIWNDFIKYVASDLKMAELDAEKERLHNCANEIVQCVTNAAKKEGYEEGTEMWDAFTSNPDTFDDICKNQVEHCAATNDVLSANIVEYVMLLLDAKRVDGCTKAVRSCYQEYCGEDYSLCVGKTYDSLVNECTMNQGDLIQTQCSGKGDDIQEYVKHVARGIFLEMDNGLAKACRNAVDAAMTKWCNGTTSCDSEFMDLNKELNSWLTYQLCDSSDADNCVQDATFIADSNMSTKWRRKLIFLLEHPEYIYFDDKTSEFNYKDPEVKSDDLLPSAITIVLNKLNESYTKLVELVEKDITVRKCMNGKTEKGLGGVIINEDHVPAYKNLTESVRANIAYGLYNQFLTQYYDRVDEINKSIMTDYASITKNRDVTRQEKEKQCEQIADELVIDSIGKQKSEAYYNGKECCIRYYVQGNGEFDVNCQPM